MGTQRVEGEMGDLMNADSLESGAIDQQFRIM